MIFMDNKKPQPIYLELVADAGAYPAVDEMTGTILEGTGPFHDTVRKPIVAIGNSEQLGFTPAEDYAPIFLQACLHQRYAPCQSSYPLHLPEIKDEEILQEIIIVILAGPIRVGEEECVPVLKGEEVVLTLIKNLVVTSKTKFMVENFF